MIASYIIIAAIVVILGTWEKSPFRIYWKSESRRAFVRTGMGGAKAVVGGGALAVPLIHKIQWVDLGETKLFVRLKEGESAITGNLLRADMDIEFYVRVKADKDSVKQAAIALGRRAENAESLRDFLEPKLIDAARAAASEMTLEEIHQNRLPYAKRVHDLLKEELLLKGLELTAVSLVSFNQTAIEHYNPNNVFDAEGLLAIKDKVEKRRKERNEIEQEQSLLIQQKNVEVRKRSLELERERAFAEQDTRKEIEAQKEESERELTQFRLEQRRQSQEANILHDRTLREKELVKEQYLEEQRIAKDRAIQLSELQKLKELQESQIAVEKTVQTASIRREVELMGEKQRKEETGIEIARTVEKLKIEKEKFLEAERIAKELELALHEVQKKAQLEEERINKETTTRLADIQKETQLVLEKQKQEMAEVEKTKSLEVAALSKQEAIASEQKAIALEKASEIKAKIQLEAAEQELLTVRTRSQAERQKLVALIRAEEEAESQKIERAVVVDTDSYKMRAMAQAKLEAAHNEAQALERLAAAENKEALMKAQAERAMIESRNIVSEHILKNERIKELIGEMAKIAGELMKPAEKIESIKVVHVDGLGPSPVTKRVEGEEEQSLLSYGGAQSAITTIIQGMLQIGAFRPVFKQLFGADDIGDLDYDRFVKILGNVAPGLLEQGAKEFVKTSVQKEVERKTKLKTEKEKKESEGSS
jgi:uncharacterized membrane protein YqiK